MPPIPSEFTPARRGPSIGQSIVSELKKKGDCSTLRAGFGISKLTSGGIFPYATDMAALINPAVPDVI